MKNLIIIITVIFLFSSCSKNENKKKVIYMVTNSQSGFNVSYANENGELTSQFVTTNSVTEKKNIYSFVGNSGDIVYISVKDTATFSFPKIFIFVDGKVYKQDARTDDKLMPVTVSGTIPY